MTQLVGGSRIQQNYNFIDMNDERLAKQLALYKVPATIRDLKQTFFYVQVNSTTTNFDPIELFTNKDINFVPQLPRTAYYYAPIGTTRPFLVGEAVNSLLDIRVPKDKYVIEIQLVEVQIESDPANWLNIADLALFDDSGTFSAERIYKENKQYVLPPGDAMSPSPGDIPIRNLYNVSLDQQFKKTAPQSMFCRIKGIDNGQPYNWSVTNNGQVSLDKSHLLMVRHGDIDYNQLELEFGHLIFKGSDPGYARFIRDDVLPTALTDSIPPKAFLTEPQILEATNTLGDKKEFTNFVYRDYNWEWFESDDPEQLNPPQDFIYPANRKTKKQGIELGVGYDANGDPVDNPGSSVNVFTAADPLKFNQQVANIYFRFSIKVQHLF